MKNTFKLLFATILFVGLWSCEDEQDLMFLTPPASFDILTPDAGTAVVLTTDLANNPALTLTWSEADYGSPTAINYNVEIAPTGTNFETFTVAGNTTNTNLTWSVAELNSAAIEAGLIPEIEGALDVRIKASSGTNESQPVYSNVVTILVTTYSSIVAKRELYIVGNAFDTNMDGVANNDDWNNNATNTPIFRDPSDDNVYYFTGYFIAGEFKLLEQKGQWQPQWGTNGGNELAVNDGTGSDPGAFIIPSDGYYSFTFNSTTMQYTLEPFTGVVPTAYPTVGIIGDSTAQGWDASTAMETGAFNPHIWRINAVLNNGEMKFRANDSWDVNWGGNTPISGLATDGGPNIPVVSGEYNVWFNSLDGRYLFIPVQ